MDAWAWVLCGLVCLILEVVVPGGFIFVFFGAGGLLVALLTHLQLIENLWAQGVLFSLFSVLAMLLFRKRLLERLTPRKQMAPVDTMVGEHAVVQQHLAPGEFGKGEYRGTSWTVQNVGDVPLHKGQRCVVEKVEGLTLWVK